MIKTILKLCLKRFYQFAETVLFHNFSNNVFLKYILAIM